jgi:hypothetical protein
MNAAEALRMANETGVQLSVEGNSLVLDAKKRPPDEILNALRRHKAEILALLAASDDAWSTEDWKAIFDERASIAEFDGRLPRAQAEAQAFECCVLEWLKRHPAGPSSPGRCVCCGQGRQSEKSVVPFEINTRERTWLYSLCCEVWHRDRRMKAEEALSALGLKTIAEDSGKRPANFPNYFAKN